jgi:predicted ATPase
MAAMARQLRCRADKQPVVITLEDAHWIDSSTLELVNRIIPLIKATRVFFLIKFRPEFAPPWLGEKHVSLLRLGRMECAESLVIISQQTAGKKLPQTLQTQIIDKADGIPLFIEELTKSVLESDLVEEGGDQYYSTRRSLDAFTVPASLVDSINARLDRLGAAKEIAQIASVIGRDFPYALLAHVASQSATKLAAALAQLVDFDVISKSGDFAEPTYTFKHALVREAAYATLPRLKRQHLHSRVADVLERHFPATVDSQPELLAHHLAQAGLTMRAVEYLQQAAQRAIEQSANAEAIGHLTWALELIKAGDPGLEHRQVWFALESLLSRAMIARYGYATTNTRESLVRAKSLIDGSTAISAKCSVLYGVWASNYVGGDIAGQRAAAAEFIKVAKSSRDVALACVGHRITGTTYLTMGEFASALHHLKQARALYNAEVHAARRHEYGQDIGATTLCYLSWTLWQLGYVDQAAQVAQEASALAERLAHPHTFVYTICHARGFMDLFRRRQDDMHAYAGWVVSICNENGFSHWSNCGTILKGWADVADGQVERGLEILRAGIAAWQHAGARLWLPVFHMLEAEAYARSGRTEAALQTIDQAIAHCEHGGERWAMAEVLRTKAKLLFLADGTRSREAEAILLNSVDIAQQQGARCWQLRASSDLSRLWQRQGCNKEALNVLQSIYAQFTEGLDTEDLLDARQLLMKLQGRQRSKTYSDDKKA